MGGDIQAGACARSRRRRDRAATLLCVWTVVAAASSWAQTAPGQLERQFGTPPSLPSGEGPTIPQTPDQRPPADADKLRFTLRRVEVVGSTVYPDDVIADIVRPLLGREISLADVFRLADELTRRYRNDGHVLSRVIVPPQNIRDGAVLLQAVEGFVAQTRLAGNSAGPRRTLEQHLDAVKAARPLAAGVLERELLLINDLPGISARAAIAPSATPEASDLTVEITEDRRQLTAGVNNRGSRSLGPWRADVAAELRQLIGYDRLTGRVIRTLADDELTFAALGYEHALGASGARAGLNLSYVDGQPSGTQNIDLPTRSRSATLLGSYPWLRSRAENLTTRLALSALRSETDFVAGGVTQRLSEDRITALRAGVTYSLVDRFSGVSVVDVELSRGLDAFGASDDSDANLSVVGGDPQFTKLTLYAARLQSLAPRWSLLAAINAQHGAQTLLSPERFAFGGEQFGRAYDVAELTGDSGAALKAELRFAGTTAMAALREYTLYSFYEIGVVHRRNTSAATSGQKARASAANVGLGLRFSMQRALTGYVEVAQPLTRDVAQEGDDDARVFVGVQATF